MDETNGSPTSDDELFVNGGTEEPEPFTFQSDLSDDDAPDPLTLDEIAKVSLAALNETLASPPTDETEPRPTSKDESTNGVTEPSAEKRRKGVRLVDIEVRLPWLAPAQRAGYRKVRVEDYRPGELDYLRTRGRRRRVSYFPVRFRDFGYRLFAGHGLWVSTLGVGEVRKGGPTLLNLGVWELWTSGAWEAIGCASSCSGAWLFSCCPKCRGRVFKEGPLFAPKCTGGKGGLGFGPPSTSRTWWKPTSRETRGNGSSNRASHSCPPAFPSQPWNWHFTGHHTSSPFLPPRPALPSSSPSFLARFAGCETEFIFCKYRFSAHNTTQFLSPQYYSPSIYTAHLQPATLEVDRGNQHGWPFLFRVEESTSITFHHSTIFIALLFALEPATEWSPPVPVLLRIATDRQNGKTGKATEVTAASLRQRSGDEQAPVFSVGVSAGRVGSLMSDPALALGFLIALTRTFFSCSAHSDSPFASPYVC
jgi:hypothetical protein